MGCFLAWEAIHQGMFMGRRNEQDTPDQGKSTVPIPDPIPAGEAQRILGVSAAKMSYLLSSGALPWTKGLLDQRVKYVSKEATMSLKGNQPTTSKDSQPRRGAKAPAQTKEAVPLAEWLDFLKISYQDLARRSREWAKQQASSTSPLARREETLMSKGVSLPTIRRIARKQQYPLPVTLQRLAAAMGITPEQLLNPPE